MTTQISIPKHTAHDMCCGACSDRLLAIEDTVNKIHTILDLAFQKLEAMTASPMIAAMFGMVNKK